MTDRVQHLTRNTKTSTAAVAKRAAALIVDYLPSIIARVCEVDKVSSLSIQISVRPAGRTDATKDPEVIIKAKPDYGDEVVTLKARLTGEGDGAQLSLISELLAGDSAFEDDETGETGEDAEAVAH